MTLHDPGLAYSVLGGWGLPVMLGGDCWVSGWPVMIAVSALVADVLPPIDVAVTITAILVPMSGTVSAYEAPVETWVQAAVTEVALPGQRSQE